jgi:pSer/pThr/pTyr-binding forkhead associated (FHA) protein/uncharacterized protein (DUF1778 family)
MAKLKIKDEHGKERLHELIDDVTSIGRASSNTIQITDEKGSRQHFRIEKQGTSFKVVDLGSTNGTKLNGVKISADIVLRVGDQLSVGKTTFTYEDEAKKNEPKSSSVIDQQALAGGETVAMDAVQPAEVKAPVATATAEAPKYVLKMLEGKTPGKIYELGAEALTIGRHNSNTIQIIDDAASNYHAEIGREPIGYVLTDLGSTNGTRVKLKNKNDFEKVVKTPLSVGMQIRVGKTLLEFDNFGKPVEDEALFGTVALDQDKLEQVLAPPPRQSSAQRFIAAAIVIACVVGIGGLAYKMRNRTVETPIVPPTPPPASNTSIANGDFEAGADESGNPRNFTIIKHPSVKPPPGVTAEAQYHADKGKLGLQITKSGAKSASTTTVVETAEPLTVDTSKTYEFSAAMKNDGDGLFGLRVTWMQGERSLTESPVVLGNTQPWTEKKWVLTPPAWAQKMKLGVFVQGTDGKACFDDLSLKVAATAPARTPAISNGGVAFTFETGRGLFSIASNGQNIVDGGTLLLQGPNGDPWSDLSTAGQATKNAEGEKTSIGGTVYDFVLQEWRPYLLEAQPGAAGTDLIASVENTENSSRTAMRFYVVGEAAKGDIAINSTNKVGAGEDKTVPSVREVLFNSGKSPQLDLTLTDPAEIEFKREGKRRRVTLYFQGKATMAFASESVGEKKAAEQLMGDIKKAIGARHWGEAETRTKELSDKYADRIPEAKAEAELRKKSIDDEWRDAKSDVQRAIDSVQKKSNDETANAAKNTVNRYLGEWAGSAHVDELNNRLKEIEGLLDQGTIQQLEAPAEAELARVKGLAKVPALYSVAKSTLQDKFLKSGGIYSRTKAAAKAKDQLAQLEKDHEQQNLIDRAAEHLKHAANPFVEVRDYQKAIEIVEKDAEYQQYKDSLTEINNLLEEWKGKLKKKE